MDDNTSLPPPPPPAVAQAPPPPPPAVAPVGVANILDVVCSNQTFKLGPLIDFPAISRKLIRIKYTTLESTENYFFVYLSQSEGMFRVLFVLDPTGSIEKGIDYVQATLEEICLQYHLNKLYNELLKLPPTVIRTDRGLVDFINNMSGQGEKQYIKIHPGFNPIFEKVHPNFTSKGLSYPLMCYFTTVGVYYGSGYGKVNSFSDIVYNKGGNTLQKLVFLQNGKVVKDANRNNRIPPVIEVLTGAYLEKPDYELCAKYKRELMSFDTNVTSLSEKDPTEMYAHVPLDTVGWNLGAMTTNMRLRSRLLPDNLELLALYVIQFLNECLPMCKSIKVDINEHFKTAMLTLLKKLTLPSWVSPPSDLFTMTNDKFEQTPDKVKQQTPDKVKQQPEVLLSDILNFLYPIRKKLKTYIELVSKLDCKDLDELEKYSEFIKYLKTFVNPMDVFNNDEKLKMLLKTDYYIDIPDDPNKILEWIKQWAELYADNSTRNVANEVLQRVLKEKNLTYGNSKIDLLDQLIKTDMFDPNNNTNFDNTTTCQLIFLIGSVIIIFQDKIKFELGLTGSTGYLDAYKSTLSKFLLDESLLSFLSELSSSPVQSPVPIVGGEKRGRTDLESEEGMLPTKQRVKQRVTVNVKLPPILKSIKRMISFLRRSS